MKTIKKIGVWTIDQNELENGYNQYWISNNVCSSQLHIYDNNWSTDYMKITNKKVLQYIKKLVLCENWSQVDKMKIFEIEYLNKGKLDYLLFNLSIKNNYFTASGEFTTRIKLDYDFSLDENLQSLYEATINDVIELENKLN